MDGGGWTEIRDAREGCELKEGEEGDREERKQRRTGREVQKQVRAKRTDGKMSETRWRDEGRGVAEDVQEEVWVGGLEEANIKSK